MAKRPYAMTETKIARFLKEGRGQGCLEAYRPWLTIHDVPSRGLRSRLVGAKTGRLHHFLSELERNVFLDCDWLESVADVREQFPLEREETISIAGRMGVRHPSDLGTDVVMTTDILVDHVARGVRRRTALSIKLSKELEQERVVEKLEIERRYWLAREVPYHVLTERETSQARARNLMALHERRTFAGLAQPRAGYWEDVCEEVLRSVSRATTGSLVDVTTALERSNGWAEGDALAAFLHLAANGRLAFDVEVPFDARMPVSRVRVPRSDERRAA